MIEMRKELKSQNERLEFQAGKELIIKTRKSWHWNHHTLELARKSYLKTRNKSTTLLREKNEGQLRQPHPCQSDQSSLKCHYVCVHLCLTRIIPIQQSL